MKNIILIGMPGAGKSTIGVVLAKTLNMRFIDTDLLLQDKEKRILQDIIKSEGIERFKEIEENVLLSLDCCETIIATGGSCVLSEQGMHYLKQNGIVIYFWVSYDEILKRISNIKTRGIAIEQGQSLRSIYNQRTPLYEKYSDLTIDCSHSGIEEIIQLVKKELNEGSLFFSLTEINKR